jgi:hypothetical protein
VQRNTGGKTDNEFQIEIFPIPDASSATCGTQSGPRPAGTAPSVIKPRNMSAKAQRRRAIKTHNQRIRARVMRQQQEQNAHGATDRGEQ